jgi:hypothetical protein
MSDDLPKIVNGNFLKHLHHFCISDDQGFSFLVHSTIKVCQEEDFSILNIHSLFLANHHSSNQIALMEKENLKLTNTISSLIR